MKQAVDRSAAVQLDRLRQFPESAAKQIGNALQTVLDGVGMQEQPLRRPGNAAVAVEQIDAGGVQKLLILPVRLQGGQRQRPPGRCRFALIDPPTARRTRACSSSRA